MINLVSRKEKQLYQQTITKIMIVLEKRFAKKIKPVINRQYMNVATFVSQGILNEIELGVNKEKARFLKLLQDHYKQVLTIFNDFVYKNHLKRVFKSPEDIFWSELNTWLLQQGKTKILKINATTQEIIFDIIKKGMEDLQSHKEIATEIRHVGKLSSLYRAETIAITETHTAANKAIDASIQSLGLKPEKEWLSAMDKRTRPDHKVADGQRVKHDEDFIIGGVNMSYPGDPRGGANQTIRCRCVLIYHTK